MRILVTGGTGFLGKRLVRQLLVDGNNVICLVRPGSDTPEFRDAAVPADDARERLHVVSGSLNRLGACADAIRAAACDTVVHAAAAMTGGPALLFMNNVVAMRQLVELLASASVRRLVHVSSLGVYGTGGLRSGDVLDERCGLDSAPHLRDAYSYSKIAQEQIAWEAHAGGKLPLVVVRPGVIYGPGRSCLTNRIGLRLGPVMVRMGGRQRLPYVHVDNCAAGLALAATVPGIEGQAFNLVDDELPQARAVLKRYGRQVERLRVVPVPYWAISPLSRAIEWYHHWSRGQLPAVLTRYKSMALWKRLRYSNENAKRVLGWVPAVGFEQGLAGSNASLQQQLQAQRRQTAGRAA